MLYEIECEKFAKKVKGQLVPRGRIQLREGLNTVLGDKAAQNSIGKSTFLLVVDFCFGGDDYINPKICKAKEKLHSHTINFAFKFGNKIEPPYINRNWLLHGRSSREIERWECIQLLNALDTIENVLSDKSIVEG